MSSNENPLNKFINFDLAKEIKFWDSKKVLLSSFIPDGKNSEVRFFRKKPENFNNILNDLNLSEQIQEDSISKFLFKNGTELKGYNFQNKLGKFLEKIPSRTVFSEIRDPFIINPWDQCLVDYAIKYGSAIDDDKENYLFGKKSGDEILIETKLSLAKILKETNLIWATRSQMVCHPESSVYGEIDEIWYDKKKELYFVGDTKTSSSVNKIGYWYQLGVYIEILKKMNSDIKDKISNVAIIQWIKIQNKKWSIKNDFSKKDSNGEYINIAKKYEYSQWILNNKIGKKPETIQKAKLIISDLDKKFSKYKLKGNECKPNDDLYWLKWNKEMKSLDEPIFKNELIYKDLKSEGILDFVKDDIAFFTKYKIKSLEDFNNLIEMNSDAKNENFILQKRYNELKEKIENEN